MWKQYLFLVSSTCTLVTAHLRVYAETETHGLKYNALKSEFIVFRAEAKVISISPSNPQWNSSDPGEGVVKDGKNCPAVTTGNKLVATGVNYPALRDQYNDAFYLFGSSRVLFGLPRHYSALAMLARRGTDGFQAIMRKRCASLLARLRGSANTILDELFGRTLALVNAECKFLSGNKFPSDFLLGASTAAYQIEGGWDADGKGQSMWDWYLHQQPDLVSDHTNGDVAADSYHLYKQDVALLKEMGAKSYRFSLSWTRILPKGTTDCINPYGIIYYNNLIDELLANDIVPFVTIYHWDLPIGFSNQGGWLTDEIVDKYADYARFAFAAFGDRIKHWITVNEPNIHCTFAYGYGLHPPLVKSPATGYYDCGRHLLLAHAKAYHIYDEEFRVLQRGKVGITVDHQWPMAASDSIDDIEATEDYQAFHLGQYLDPIFRGDYPQRMVDRVAVASLRQGYNSSRLRPFTEEQKHFIKGTTDFVGINHYSSNYVYRNASVVRMYEVPSFDDDAGYATFIDPSWPESAFPPMAAYAPGFNDLLLYIKEAYVNPELYVTENGFSETLGEDLHDDQKVDYLRTYLDALLDAKAAGCNVQGYFFWSLLDTFEWVSGYDIRFALHQVDIDDPARPRTPRKSALVYKEIIRTGVIDYNYNPDPYEQKK